MSPHHLNALFEKTPRACAAVALPTAIAPPGPAPAQAISPTEPQWCPPPRRPHVSRPTKCTRTHRLVRPGHHLSTSPTMQPTIPTQASE